MQRTLRSCEEVVGLPNLESLEIDTSSRMNYQPLIDSILEAKLEAKAIATRSNDYACE